MAIISSFQTWYFFTLVPDGPPAHRAIYLASAYSLLWALATPVVLLLARIFPVDRTNLLTHIPLHILLSILVGVSVRICFLLAQAFWPVLNPPRPITPDRALSDIVTSFDYQAMVYWVILAIHQGAVYYGKYQLGQLRASRLETQLAMAQLSGLRMQLQPHFLFNTLNAINSLIHLSPHRASEMLVRLSEFLRLSLDNTGEPLVPLDREIDFIERYLEIEHARFEDRLTVRYQLDPEALSCLVPNLLLQPLVENAIKHGIARESAPGVLTITANRRNEILTLCVANSGPPLTSDPLLDPARPGIGLTNTVARLRALYGASQEFRLANRPEGGVEAWVRIPAKSPTPAEDQPDHESTNRR